MSLLLTDLLMPSTGQARSRCFIHIHEQARKKDISLFLLELPPFLVLSLSHGGAQRHLRRRFWKEGFEALPVKNTLGSG